MASIAFGIPEPVVDGNVLRLFTRFFGIKEAVDTQKGKTAVLEKAKEYIDPLHPGDFNQAIMEFGALQCKPSPDCTVCPLKTGCAAFQNGKVAEFPVKSKKQGQRNRYFHYLVILSGKGKNRKVFLNKRTEKDIWKNLFDFPMIETEKEISLKKLVLSKEWKTIFHDHKIEIGKESKPYRHILSHQIILAKFYQVEIPATVSLPFLKVNFNKIEEYPVPRLVEKYLEEVVNW